MVSSSLPAAFGFLPKQRNPSADAALVEALPSLAPFARAAALDILVERGNAAAMAEVAGRFLDYDDGLRRLIASRVSALSSGVGVAVASSSLKRRESAIEMIVHGGAGRLAYLMADALRLPCARTRELAAAGLHAMTANLLDRLDAGPTARELKDLNQRVDGLAEALGTAVHRWEIHLQPKVLEAALWLGDRTMPAILRKLRGGRANVVRALADVLEGTSDPRLTGFVLRALSMPELRAAAAGAIGRAHDAAFLKALMREGWLLADARIERGCRWIRDVRRPQDFVDALVTLDGPAAAGGVRLLAAMGGGRERKVERFRRMIAACGYEIRRVVVWHLVNDESDAATELLTILACREGDGVAAMAARELRRRRGGSRLDLASPARVTDRTYRAAGHQVFERFWRRFDDLDAAGRTEAGEAIRRCVPDPGPMLRAKLASAETLDRVRALRMAQCLGAVEALSEALYRSASDQDPIIRSLAVSILVGLPGPAAERLLRSAVNDSDARVQANAIEALDRIDAADRVLCTVPKLESSDGRVRANAVKSLLRAELRQAGDVLLDMLDDPSPDHRLGALWVIEQLRLKSALPRVEDIRRGDADHRVRQRAARVLEVVADDGGFRPHAPEPPSQDTPLSNLGGIRRDYTVLRSRVASPRAGDALFRPAPPTGGDATTATQARMTLR